MRNTCGCRARALQKNDPKYDPVEVKNPFMGWEGWPVGILSPLPATSVGSPTSFGTCSRVVLRCRVLPLPQAVF